MCAIARFNLGVTAWYEGDAERAHKLFMDGLEVFRSLEDNWWIAFSVHGLADIARTRNDREQARPSDDRHVHPGCGRIGSITRCCRRQSRTPHRSRIAPSNSIMSVAPAEWWTS